MYRVGGPRAVRCLKGPCGYALAAYFAFGLGGFLTGLAFFATHRLAPTTFRALGHGFVVDGQKFERNTAGHGRGLGQAHGHALAQTEGQAGIRAAQGLALLIVFEILPPKIAHRDQPVGAGLVEFHNTPNRAMPLMRPVNSLPIRSDR